MDHFNIENHQVVSLCEFVTGFVTMCNGVIAVTRYLKAQLKVRSVWFASHRFKRTAGHPGRKAQSWEHRVLIAQHPQAVSRVGHQYSVTFPFFLFFLIPGLQPMWQVLPTFTVGRLTLVSSLWKCPQIYPDYGHSCLLIQSSWQWRLAINQLFWQHFKTWFNILDSFRKNRVGIHSQWHTGLGTGQLTV